MNKIIIKISKIGNTDRKRMQGKRTRVQRPKKVPLNEVKQEATQPNIPPLSTVFSEL